MLGLLRAFGLDAKLYTEYLRRAPFAYVLYAWRSTDDVYGLILLGARLVKSIKDDLMWIRSFSILVE